jgi:hypothetical protein
LNFCAVMMPGTGRLSATSKTGSVTPLQEIVSAARVGGVAWMKMAVAIVAQKTAGAVASRRGGRVEIMDVLSFISAVLS